MTGRGPESAVAAAGAAGCAATVGAELATVTCASLVAFSRVHAQDPKANPKTRQFITNKHTKLSNFRIIRLVFRVALGAAWGGPAMQYQCSSHTTQPWAPQRCTCLGCRW